MIKEPANDNHSLMLKDIQISRLGIPLFEIGASIRGGEILTIMGPSGSGKSTLLAYVGGFLSPNFKAQGSVILDDRNITFLPANKRKIGILFQDDYLFPHLSIIGNLMFAMPSVVKGNNRRKMAENALKEIGLSDFGDRDPGSLSGGQRARTALIRVLLSEPQALLLDEPFSKLDMNLRNQIRNFVFEKARERNLPVLMVTHDKMDADAAGGKILTIGET